MKAAAEAQRKRGPESEEENISQAYLS